MEALSPSSSLKQKLVMLSEQLLRVELNTRQLELWRKKNIVSIGVFWFIWDTKGCQLLYLKYRTDLFLLSGP